MTAVVGERRSGARPHVAASLSCAAVVVLSWFAADHWHAATTFDIRALEQLRVSLPRDDLATNNFVGLIDPPRYALFVAGLIAIPLLRRRPRLAIATALAVAGANVTCVLLKQLVAPASIAGMGALRWPSGHAAAAAVLACCLVVVVPRRARLPAAAVAGGLLGGVGCALVALGSHLPSDVLAGIALGAAFALLVPLVERDRPPAWRRWPVAASVALLGVVLLALGTAVLRDALGPSLEYLGGHAAGAGALALIAAVSSALVATSTTLAR